MTDIFNITTKPAIYHKLDNTNKISSEIGFFDKLYYFEDEWSDEQVCILAKWLSHNCTKNFIFSTSVKRIIAGGTSDHLYSWEHRGEFYEDMVTFGYYIKLYKEDITAFELVWLTDHLNCA